MDTRTKILTLQHACSLDAESAVIVAGYFDVLRAEHVRALLEIRRRMGAGTLLAMVLPFAEEVLSQRARSEMAASLRVIDYVVSGDDRDLDGLIAALHPNAIVRLETDDARRNQELTQHVKHRQN